MIVIIIIRMHKHLCYIIRVHDYNRVCNIVTVKCLDIIPHLPGSSADELLGGLIAVPV